MTDGIRNFMVKQKQKLILTNSKNILTYRFQPILRLQPNFMAEESRRTFIHAKYSGDNPKVKIFLLILQIYGW